MAFATPSEIAEFISGINPDFGEEDINDVVLNATTQMIQLKTGRNWIIDAGPIYVDGRGECFVFCPIVPINELTGLFIINNDETEEEIAVDGDERQIVFNDQTGEIRSINNSNVFETQDGFINIFPEGLKNIRIEGSFGPDIAEYPALKLLQILLYLQKLAIQDPDKYGASDIVSEKIGEYSYVKSQMERGDLKNQRKTLDGQINDLYDLLTDSGSGVLAI